jgi:hypothetical protein
MRNTKSNLPFMQVNLFFDRSLHSASLLLIMFADIFKANKIGYLRYLIGERIWILRIRKLI